MNFRRSSRTPPQTESIRDLYQALGMGKEITERAMRHLDAPPVKSLFKNENAAQSSLSAGIPLPTRKGPSRN